MTGKISKISKTIKMNCGCGSMFIKIDIDKKGDPYVDVRLGKSGSCQAAWAHSISILLSLALRHYPVDVIIQKINGCRCPSPHVSGGVTVLSCPDAICKGLEELTKLPELSSLTKKQ